MTNSEEILKRMVKINKNKKVAKATKTRRNRKEIGENKRMREEEKLQRKFAEKEKRDKIALTRKLEKEKARKQIADMKKKDLKRKKMEKSKREAARKIRDNEKSLLKKKMCSDKTVDSLVRDMKSLSPSKEDINKLTQKSYTKLRTDISKTLSKIRDYSSKCNKNYINEKTEKKPKRSRRNSALNIPNRDIFIPDIGEEVPDKCPISERAFNEARKKLNLTRKVVETPLPIKKKKKRIAPTQVV